MHIADHVLRNASRYAGLLICTNFAMLPNTSSLLWIKLWFMVDWFMQMIEIKLIKMQVYNCDNLYILCWSLLQKHGSAVWINNPRKLWSFNVVLDV